MEMYNEKTEGAYIETKESNIIWNFENTEYEYGRIQAKELKSFIEQVFKNLPIVVNEYKTFIQVVPNLLRNDKFIRGIIDKNLAPDMIDFVMYIGDSN